MSIARISPSETWLGVGSQQELNELFDVPLPDERPGEAGHVFPPELQLQDAALEQPVKAAEAVQGTEVQDRTLAVRGAGRVVRPNYPDNVTYVPHWMHTTPAAFNAGQRHAALVNAQWLARR